MTNTYFTTNSEDDIMFDKKSKHEAGSIFIERR